jgi:tRNA U34 2-thiouridine synthase MnmA/TrmU
MSAQTRDENKARCKAGKSERDVEACTSLINSGQNAEDNLAAFLNNRCNGNYNLGKFDLAIKDCDQAIRLKRVLKKARCLNSFY